MQQLTRGRDAASPAARDGRRYPDRSPALNAGHEAEFDKVPKGRLNGRYIKNQEEHHRKVTFQEEFLAFLKRHRIEFDKRYLWA
jgi:hypothetical protein